MGKVVVFRIRNEEYAIPLQFVISIEKMEAVTPIPNMPDYVKGISEIRKELIPIVDLEYIFYHHFLEKDDNVRLIVIKSDNLSLGILVNEAKEIIDVPEDQIKQVGLIAFADTAYISGVASLEGRLITIINPEALIGSLEGIEDLETYMASHR